MKRFLFIVVSILVVNLLFATSIESIPIKVTQPNGDSITIIQYGDEYGIWYETLDGYVVEKNSSNYWVYVNTNTNGNLVLTNQIVDNISSPIGINLTNVFNVITNYRINAYEVFNNDSIYCPDLEDEETLFAIQQGEEYDIERAKAPAQNKGSINVLTILIQFQDVKFEQPTAVQNYFDRLMNEEDFIHPNNQNNITGSVREYWEDVSYGQLSTNTIVVGPYTAKYPISNYRTIRNADQSIDASKVKKLIKEAVTKAAKDVNMQMFDNDNNGCVDFVHIVYAGEMDSIWPHSSSFRSIVRDWRWISKYIITSEKERNLPASIGIICHEMGHAFGAPDFYDRDADGSGGYFDGTGTWDLMASGDKNNNRNSPAHPNPYIKTKIYKWATASELIGNNREYKLRPSELDSNSIYKLSTSTPNEYYLLENRQCQKLRGRGLVIYHVNAGIENVDRSKINIKHPQNLYVVDANNHIAKPTGTPDSYGKINKATATFKDTITNNIFFTSQTKPSNCDWAGNITQNKDVCFISEEVINGEKCIKFVLNPEIEGPDVLCDSAVYSIKHVPADATIEWTYVAIPGMTLPDVPVLIGSGQGTTEVCYKRGIILEGGTFQDTLDVPDVPFVPVPASITPPTFVPYSGDVTIKVNITFNGNTHSLFKTITMPEEPKDIEIERLNFGSLNVWCKGVTKTMTLKSSSEENWMNDVIWYVDVPGHAPYFGLGSSISVTPTATGTAIIIATLPDECNPKSDTAVYEIVQILGTSFVNPVSGSVEINIIGGDELGGDSNVSTMALDNQTGQYIGACRLELWHDIYGKVREMDVPENTSVVTMDLGGLSSGIYVLRLIVDNQIIETSQMIIK